MKRTICMILSLCLSSGFFACSRKEAQKTGIGSFVEMEHEKKEQQRAKEENSRNELLKEIFQQGVEREGDEAQITAFVQQNSDILQKFYWQPLQMSKEEHLELKHLIDVWGEPETQQGQEKQMRREGQQLRRLKQWHMKRIRAQWRLLWLCRRRQQPKIVQIIQNISKMLREVIRLQEDLNEDLIHMDGAESKLGRNMVMEGCLKNITIKKDKIGRQQESPFSDLMILRSPEKKELLDMLKQIELIEPKFLSYQRFVRKTAQSEKELDELLGQNVKKEELEKKLSSYWRAFDVEWLERKKLGPKLLSCDQLKSMTIDEIFLSLMLEPKLLSYDQLKRLSYLTQSSLEGSSFKLDANKLKGLASYLKLIICRQEISRPEGIPYEEVMKTLKIDNDIEFFERLRKLRESSVEQAVSELGVVSLLYLWLLKPSEMLEKLPGILFVPRAELKKLKDSLVLGEVLLCPIGYVLSMRCGVRHKKKPGLQIDKKNLYNFGEVIPNLEIALDRRLLKNSMTRGLQGLKFMLQRIEMLIERKAAVQEPELGQKLFIQEIGFNLINDMQKAITELYEELIEEIEEYPPSDLMLGETLRIHCERGQLKLLEGIQREIGNLLSLRKEYREIEEVIDLFSEWFN